MLYLFDLTNSLRYLSIAVGYTQLVMYYKINPIKVKKM